MGEYENRKRVTLEQFSQEFNNLYNKGNKTAHVLIDTIMSDGNIIDALEQMTIIIAKQQIQIEELAKLIPPINWEYDEIK